MDDISDEETACQIPSSHCYQAISNSFQQDGLVANLKPMEQKQLFQSALA